MSVIFLAGVHGVGKGYLGAPVAKLLGINHCTASQLIREEKGHATWGKDKLVAEVDDNQLALIRAVERRRESGQKTLLDGHFVLRGASRDLIRLPAAVFSGLHLMGVILLTEKTETIAKRLADRDGVSTSPASIAELAAEEAAHAQNICGALKLPLTVVPSPSERALADAVAQLLAK